MWRYHGCFVWHELMTTDPAAAKDFYQAAIGWGVMPGGIPDMEYDMWTTERSPIGGCMQLPQQAQDMGAPSHWIPYIGAEDVDVTFALASERGCRVYVPVTDIPGVGRFAVLADPAGATFAIYQAADPANDEVPPLAGDFSWHELATPDAKAALALYGALFGWQEMEAHDMGPIGMYYLFGTGGHIFGGIFNKPAEMPGPPYWLSYVRVASAADSATAILDAGGRILNGPMEVPGGDVVAQCLDPQGAAFAIHQMP